MEGKEVQFEVGRMARLADGSCMVRHGDTTVLATAVYKREPLPPGGTDFLPLQVGGGAAAAGDALSCSMALYDVMARAAAAVDALHDQLFIKACQYILSIAGL
jgi:hypothetical protein